MAIGFAALLDDIAALARMAAANADDVAAASMKVSAKAAGVVVDDAAVAPQYVRGVNPKRELPIIWKITKGSLLNKAIILVFALLLSQFAPWVLTPLLMLGGTYLCFEGAHKIWELVTGDKEAKEAEPSVVQGEEAEKKVVSGAVRTDFILSAEIMVSLSTRSLTSPSLIAPSFSWLSRLPLRSPFMVSWVFSSRWTTLGSRSRNETQAPRRRSAHGLCGQCRSP